LLLHGLDGLIWIHHGRHQHGVLSVLLRYHGWEKEPLA
jgi:hypothetical protein